MNNTVTVLQYSKKGWQKTAGLTFKKSLPAAAAVTLTVFAAQIAGVCISLYLAAKTGWQTVGYDSATGGELLIPWGPRLETLMSKGAWFPLSAAGYLLILMNIAMAPVRMAGGAGIRNTFSRMPLGGCAPQLGSIFSGLSFALFYWAAELACFFVSALLYRQFVPEAVQIPHPAMMALLRWDVLGGLFPAAEPGLVLMLALTVLVQVISMSCIGWNLAEGRQSAANITVLTGLLIASVFQYHIGLGNPIAFFPTFAAALTLSADLIRRQFTARKEEP